MPHTYGSHTYRLHAYRLPLFFIIIISVLGVVSSSYNTNSVYDISTNTTLIAWTDDSDYIWLTFLDVNKITLKTSFIGKQPSLQYLPIISGSQTYPNVVYLTYFNANRLICSTSTDFGYTWVTNVVRSFATDISLNTTLSTATNAITISIIASSKLIICTDNENKITCYVTLNGGVSFLSKTLNYASLITNYDGIIVETCAKPYVYSDGGSKWYMLITCNRFDNITNSIKSENIYIHNDLFSLNNVPVLGMRVSDSNGIPQLDPIVKSNSDNRFFMNGYKTGEEILLMTNSNGLYRTYFGTTIFGLRNYTMNKILDDLSSYSVVIDLVDNLRWVYVSYNEATQYIRVFQSFDNCVSFTLQQELYLDNAINDVFNSAFADFDSSLIVTMHRDTSWYSITLSLNNSTASPLLLNSNYVSTPQPKPTIISGVYGEILINDVLVLSGNVNLTAGVELNGASLSINGDLILNANKTIKIINTGSNPVISTTSTIFINGGLDYETNGTMPRTVTVATFSTSSGDFTDIIINGESIDSAANDCTELEYTSSSLQLVTTPDCDAPETNIAMIAIICSIGFVVVIGVVVVMIKFKSKIFIFRARTIESKAKLELVNISNTYSDKSVSHSSIQITPKPN